jgi:hypothetical protein
MYENCTTRKLGTIFLALFLLIVLAACSAGQPTGAAPEQKSAKPAPKPAETQTGREAFQHLYMAARGWAPDAKPFRLESQVTSDANGHGGKAAVWRGFFASAARGAVKPYIWSGSSAEGAPERGISPGPEDTYNPANTSTKPFDVAFLKTDSTDAFEQAQKHGGETLLKGNASLPVSYALDLDPRKNQLAWHVIYGASRSEAKLTVDVNATSGAFLRSEK